MDTILQYKIYEGRLFRSKLYLSCKKGLDLGAGLPYIIIFLSFSPLLP